MHVYHPLVVWLYGEEIECPVECIVYVGPEERWGVGGWAVGCRYVNCLPKIATLKTQLFRTDRFLYLCMGVRPDRWTIGGDIWVIKNIAINRAGVARAADTARIHQRPAMTGPLYVPRVVGTHLSISCQPVSPSRPKWPPHTRCKHQTGDGTGSYFLGRLSERFS